MAREKYNTPKRNCVIKTRLTEQEREDFEEKCQRLHMNQSEVMREMIFNMGVCPTLIIKNQANQDMLERTSELLTQFSRVGNNLNQLARHFNSGGEHNAGIRKQLRDELTALSNFRLDAEKLIGECYGDHKAYRIEKL